MPYTVLNKYLICDNNCSYFFSVEILKGEKCYIDSLIYYEV